MKNIKRGQYDLRTNIPDTKNIATSIRNRGGVIETPTVVEAEDFVKGVNETYVSMTGHIRIAEAANQGIEKIYVKIYRKDLPEHLRFFTALESQFHNHELNAAEYGAAIIKACSIFRTTQGELPKNLVSQIPR